MLAVKLKPGERLVVNGAVLRNGNSRNVIYFANRASILRERDIMQEEQATTPARRAYFVVQLMLLDRDDAEAYEPAFQLLVAALLRTFKAASILQALTDCAHWVDAHDYYKALSALRTVLDYEAELLSLPARPKAVSDEAAERVV